MSTKKERETLHSIPEASQLTNIPERTLYYAVKRNFLKHTKISGKPFVTIADIEAWKADPGVHKPGRK
jgi:hypothetical protein